MAKKIVIRNKDLHRRAIMLLKKLFSERYMDELFKLLHDKNREGLRKFILIVGAQSYVSVRDGVCTVIVAVASFDLVIEEEVSQKTKAEAYDLLESCINGKATRMLSLSPPELPAWLKFEG